MRRRQPSRNEHRPSITLPTGSLVDSVNRGRCQSAAGMAAGPRDSDTGHTSAWPQTSRLRTSTSRSFHEASNFGLSARVGESNYCGLLRTSVSSVAVHYHHSPQARTTVHQPVTSVIHGAPPPKHCQRHAQCQWSRWRTAPAPAPARTSRAHGSPNPKVTINPNVRGWLI